MFDSAFRTMPAAVFHNAEDETRSFARDAVAASETLRQAGLVAEQVSAVYFTGGSTGLGFLTERIADLFPYARQVKGDRFSSVATGLGIYAQRRIERQYPARPNGHAGPGSPA